ncbi:MAG: GNAT family N-acetyltransferase [Bacilli bacterium]|nr:GNAT family N-acetyltransferase [Bacilli bacterium]MDD3305457.1 GNAT family N-acetyltransferase [Bacilli bacterium]MDD4053950.1 GNAT family N-acetyltransferase [Bacilli bacterium]MDD4411210.1 GNAT family N-acetyltransferase [Bacilli bacterium]
MDNIIIRDVKIEDIPQMAIVRQNVWSTTYRGIYEDESIDNFDYAKVEQSFREKTAIPNVMFKVALCDNKIVGYVCFGKIDNPYKESDYCIRYIHILKDCQGAGLGRKFFNMILEYIAMNNIKSFYVSCNKYNYPAHKYYEKMGFVKDDVISSKNKKEEQIIYVYRVGNN